MSRKIDRADAPHAGLLHPLPGRSERALRVDRAAGVLDHSRGKPELARIERSPCDAEVGREPADIDARDTALAEVARKTRARGAVGFDECRVAVHTFVIALA